MKRIHARECFFVTGTGTDVGKTVISSALARGFLLQKKSVLYWKPVQTGLDHDAQTVQSLAGNDTNASLTIYPTRFHFPLAASPDQAAQDAGMPAATVTKLKEEWRERCLKSLDADSNARDNKVVLIEGAGGVLVPLNEQNETWLHFIREIKPETIVVGSSTLGTLNHTALTIEKLHSSGVAIRAVIIQGEAHPANMKSLRRQYPNVPFIAFPHIKNFSDKEWDNACQTLVKQIPPPQKTSLEKIRQADAEHVWHPFTQHQDAAPAIVVERAKGVWLYTTDGERLLDAVGSWWTNTIGHGVEEIGAAIHRQQQTLDHCLFSTLTHEPGSLLAQRLSALTDHTFSRVFFSDNGSCALEVAIKMAAQYFVNLGETERNLILGFEGTYHGDTFGAMSAAGNDVFHGAFRPFFFKTLRHAPVTLHPSSVCPEGSAALATYCASLDTLLTQNASRLAAVVIEPLLQGAGGMLLQDIRFLRFLRQRTQELGIPLIYDEVFTGMGRSGDFFTFKRYSDITPDIVCAAKGLTGGNLALAVTLASEKIFAGFLGPDKTSAFLHGHSYTANPIACAAALATLDFYEKNELIQKSQRLEQRFKTWITEEGSRLNLTNPRALGAVLAFEFPDSGIGDYHDTRASQVPQLARAQGLFLRPLGNTIYVCPPLTITPEETDFLLQALQNIVIRVLSERDSL